MVCRALCRMITSKVGVGSMSGNSYLPTFICQNGKLCDCIFSWSSRIWIMKGLEDWSTLYELSQRHQETTSEVLQEGHFLENM
ncbi:uncharacterized protein LOC142555593 isoform X3 [Primulina tabacum]|uniref:uncharacterized protein LOC142555593 isoform X3 n=1 Tax=Primulina tabacum TaxID=48773 RepID=UPI003F5A4FD4